MTRAAPAAKRRARLPIVSTPPPCWTGRGALGVQKIVPPVTVLRFLEALSISFDWTVAPVRRPAVCCRQTKTTPRCAV